MQKVSEASSARSRSVRVFQNGIHFIYSSPNPGYAANTFGRKAVCTSNPYRTIHDWRITAIADAYHRCRPHPTPTGTLSPDACLIYLRHIPHSPRYWRRWGSSHVSLYYLWPLEHRGTMLSYISSNQGWGSFFGSLATIIVLLCFKSAMEGEGKYRRLMERCVNSPWSFWPFNEHL